MLFDDARGIAEELSWLKRNYQGQTHTPQMTRPCSRAAPSRADPCVGPPHFGWRWPVAQLGWLQTPPRRRIPDDVEQKHGPFFALEGSVAQLTFQVSGAVAGAAVDECSGIPGLSRIPSTGSAMRVVHHFNTEGILGPRRARKGAHAGELLFSPFGALLRNGQLIS